MHAARPRSCMHELFLDERGFMSTDLLLCDRASNRDSLTFNMESTLRRELPDFRRAFPRQCDAVLGHFALRARFIASQRFHHHDAVPQRNLKSKLELSGFFFGTDFSSRIQQHSGSGPKHSSRAYVGFCKMRFRVQFELPPRSLLRWFSLCKCTARL